MDSRRRRFNSVAAHQRLQCRRAIGGSEDEARRIAANIAKLRELVRKQ